jgi:hypothetical protein
MFAFVGRGADCVLCADAFYFADTFNSADALYIAGGFQKK